jgi:hypothetical protein
MSVRYNEANSLGSWLKIAAGYADSAGAVDFANLTSKASGTGTYTTTGDFRAPIFYDSNDTTYLADLASTTSECARFAGGIVVSRGNVTGNGIILADDGDIVDLNDGYCAMRFSSGVRIHSGNRTGGVVITLASSGTITATADVVAYSDARVKENIKTIEKPLEKVLSLRGVSYNRTDTEDKSTKIGVIAQETQPIVPEVIHEQEDGMLGVAYGNFAGLFIEAFKEQQQQINELKELVNKLINK